MKEQMKKILRQQQEYEYIKKCPSLLYLPNNIWGSDFLSETVFPYIKKATRNRKRQKRNNKIGKIIFYIVFFYYILCLISYYSMMLLYPFTLIE